MASKELTEKQKEAEDLQKDINKITNYINGSKRYIIIAIIAFIILAIILIIIYLNLDNISKHNSRILNIFIIILGSYSMIGALVSFVAIFIYWEQLSSNSRELKSTQAELNKLTASQI